MSDPDTTYTCLGCGADVNGDVAPSPAEAQDLCGGCWETEDDAAVVRISKPGIYPDLAEKDYRAQTDWLSVSGAKKLLPPSCPAKFKATLGVEDHKPQFDIGKAFHAKVLGDGAEVVVVDALDWRGKDAKAERTAAYERGAVPILITDAAVVDAMYAAIANHDVAPHLFTGGASEVSAFWLDHETGVKCKARFDYLPDKQAGRRLIVPDLKSAVSADPEEFARAAARYGYLFQQVHYSNALRTLGVDDDPAFLFVVVEKDAPHLVNVGQFAEKDDLHLAVAALDKALRLYRTCLEADHWPGWPGVTDLSLPTWHKYQLEEIAS